MEKKKKNFLRAIVCKDRTKKKFAINRFSRPFHIVYQDISRYIDRIAQVLNRITPNFFFSFIYWNIVMIVGGDSSWASC